MNRFAKISLSFLSFAGSLALCSGIVAMQRPLPTAPAQEEQAQVINLPEVVIVGEVERAHCFDDARRAPRSELRARYGLDAGDEIKDAPTADEACERVQNAVRNGFDKGPAKRSHRADRSAPTGSRPVRSFVHTLEQGGAPMAPTVLVTEF